jgi:hypothetical protein
MTDEARAGAVEGIQELADAADLADGEAGAQTLLEQVRSRGDVVQADIDSDSGVLWAVLQDGTTYNLILNQSPAVQAAGDAQHAAAAAALGRVSTREYEGVPKGKKAYVRDSLGDCFDLSVTPQIRQYLEDAGYDVDLATGLETIEDYRGITGASVVYVHSHGGFVRTSVGIRQTESGSWALDYGPDQTDPAKKFAIWTETPFTAANLKAYEAEIKSGDLVAAAAITDRKADGGCTKPTKFMVTSSFVEKHWTLEKDSVVFLNTCFSGNSEITEVLFGKGAGLVLGWDHLSSSTVTPRFIMDRMLGANTYQPKTPDQRAFNWVEVKREAEELGILTTEFDESENTFQEIFSPVLVNSNLLFIANPDQDPGTLRPSIEELAVWEERDRLFIDGWFGSEQGKVTVNGTPVTVHDWDPDRVQVTIPRSGPGSYGDVIVEVDGRKSNAVPLTEWRGTLEWWFAPDTAFEQRMSWDVHMRADIHSLRTVLDDAPTGESRDITFSNDSTGELTAKGIETTQVSQGNTKTLEWTGGETIAWPDVEGDGTSQTVLGEVNLALNEDGTVDPSGTTIVLSMTANASHTVNRYENGSLVSSGEQPVIMLWSFGLADTSIFGVGAVTMKLDSDFDILPEKRSAGGGGGTTGYFLEWSRMEARGVPTKDQSR